MSTRTVQYTIRGVPADWDRQVRQRAKADGKALNAELLGMLKESLGVSNVPQRFSDLDHLAGTWVVDPEFDRAIAELDRVDEAAWK